MKLIHHDRRSMELYFADTGGGYITVDYGMSVLPFPKVIELVKRQEPSPTPPPEPMEYGAACSIGGG